MNVQTKPTAADPPRGDAHRRQARRYRRAHRGAQSLQRRGGRHGAGGARRSMCARPSPRPHAFKPKLTRYERQQILLRTAELLRDRKEEFARMITAESGLCWKDSLYEAGRAYDVYSFAGQLTIKDDGEIYSCDISPQGKPRKIFTTRMPLRRRDLGDHAVQSSAQHGVAQARAGDRDQQPRGAQADRTDAADRARARRRALRGRPAAGDAVGRHRQSLDHGRCDDHRSGLRPDHLHRFGEGRQIHRRARPAIAASCWSSAATIR